MAVKTKVRPVRSKAKKYGKIGILMGGPSSEREVSLKSGKAVYEALKLSGIDAVCIDITTDDIGENAKLIKSYGLDCIFLALHGRFGEDGTVQDLLECLSIPYTGSGVLASRLTMDKIASRRILEIYGLAVPKYRVLDKSHYSKGTRYSDGFVFPLVVKPASHGSSIGLSIIDKKEDLATAIDCAFAYDDKIIFEEFIEGRELTVGILDNKPLPVIEIIPKNRFFDFEAKYLLGNTEYRVPAELEGNIAKKVQRAALKAHQLLGCSGCCRADIILCKNSIPFILELNSIPGFTPKSLLPKAAKASGIEFPELCIRLIELAYEKNKNKISR